MKKLEISSGLQEKIYDLQSTNAEILKITTYFPLSHKEKLEVLESAEKINSIVDFKSIFSDMISETEWIKTKERIKKKFQDELMNID